MNTGTKVERWVPAMLLLAAMGCGDEAATGAGAGGEADAGCGEPLVCKLPASGGNGSGK